MCFGSVFLLRLLKKLLSLHPQKTTTTYLISQMVFSDLLFLFAFIPAFILLYLIAGGLDRRFAINKHTIKNFVLVVFSLLFYAWGEPVYMFLMLACVFINYIAGLLINFSKRGRKFFLFLGVLLDIGILCSFKYLGFFADTFAHFGVTVDVPRLPLPIGISFYVFQSITYLADVYRRESPVQKSYWGLLLYISMFPQLIAGPIVRYGTIAEEIHNRHVTSKDVADGVFRFLIGLGKKVIIANQIGEIATQMLANGQYQESVAAAWIGMIAFTLQIYFDFSGYSDMAIGIGRCLGFHFCENFDHPYCSRTITEFWRRWHMSLGTFFRDYVYIPLGGNRRHQIINIFIVWFLTGMWHGASWNFIIWGLYFGIILVVEKHTLLKIKGHVPSPLLHVYTMVIVTVGFGIFYFDDFGRLTDFFRVAFGIDPRPLTDFVSTNILFTKFWLWIAALLLCMPVRRTAGKIARKMLNSDGFVYKSAHLTSRFALAAMLLIVSVVLLIGATNNTFLYTRF